MYHKITHCIASKLQTKSSGSYPIDQHLKHQVGQLEKKNRVNYGLLRIKHSRLAIACAVFIDNTCNHSKKNKNEKK